MLYREPKLLKGQANADIIRVLLAVSVLYREPKLLKGEGYTVGVVRDIAGFSALP